MAANESALHRFWLVVDGSGNDSTVIALWLNSGMEMPGLLLRDLNSFDSAQRYIIGTTSCAIEYRCVCIGFFLLFLNELC